MCQPQRLPFAQLACKTPRLARFITLLLAIGMTGCGRTSETPSTPAPAPPTDAQTKAPAEKTLKAALVTPGPVSDNGWNAGAYKGLQAVKTETGAEIQNVEAKSPGEQEENVRGFASKGYDIVYCHGSEFEGIALKLESDFPKTLFVVSSGSKIGKNTTPVVLKLEDGAYLLGMLAAGMSQTGKVAQVGAEKSAPVESVFKAFEAGAKALKPSITVVPPVYTGDWEDVGKAKQATFPLIDQGADVIIQNLDAAAQGIFQAVQERAKAGKTVYALGTNSDQNAVAPDVILASAPIEIDKAFVAIAKDVKAGTFKPNDTPFDMKSGTIGFVLNPQLEAKIPADLKAKLDDAKKKIMDGSLKITRGSP